MKTKNFRHSLYARTFAGFLLIWFVLFSAFSAYLVWTTRAQIRSLFLSLSSNLSYPLFPALPERDPALAAMDRALSETPYIRYISLFDGDGHLISSSGDPVISVEDSSLVITPDQPSSSVRKCDLRNTLSANDLETLQAFLAKNFALSRSELLSGSIHGNAKIGGVSFYAFEIQTGWMNDTTLFPERIAITPFVYTAVSGDNFSVKSVSADTVYLLGTPPSIEGLTPLEESVTLEMQCLGDLLTYPTDGSAPRAAARSPELYALSQSEEAYRDYLYNNTYALEQTPIYTPGYLYETYYFVVPYARSWEVKQDTSDVSYLSNSDGSVVFTGESYPLRETLPVLLPVGGGSLVMFLLAALLVSHSLCKTYTHEQALERARRETANALAHDLRTPLSLIRGYAENLLCGAAAGKQAQYLTAIREESDRMNGMLSQMLDFSRLERPSLPLHPEPLNLMALAGAAAAPYLGLCAARQVSLDIAATGTLTGDRALLLRALDNLLSNAVQHVPDGGAIALTCRPDRMTVQNTGVPIPDTILPRIWEPYFRGDAARSQERHTGLGLAIVRAIANKHGFTPYAQNLPDGVCIGFVRK